MKNFLSAIWNNQVGRALLCIFIGVVIGALFYPSKRIEERERQTYEEKLTKLTDEYQKETKQLQESVKTLESQKTEMRIELVKTVSKLTNEIKQLQASKKETYYKIVRPDGTIEIKKYTESEVNETSKVITQVQEEFKQKITEIQEQYKAIHQERVEILQRDYLKKEQEYKDTIATLEKSKVVEINAKKYGMEVGYLSNKDYYTHGTMDIFGPVFLGVQSQTNFLNDFAIGGGVGLHF